jgi:hypothetical protein
MLFKKKDAVEIMPNNIEIARPTVEGINLLLPRIESKGRGKSMSNNATAENVEPAGVKLTALAKSKGMNRPKNENMLIALIIAALP